MTRAIDPHGTDTAAGRPAFVVALLGAESTGKSSLATALAERARQAGLHSTVVAEHLREFCEAARRTPERHEQTLIAGTQSRRIEQAGLHAEFVIADTTALMTAVYSDMVFGDPSLYATALAAHRRVDLTLLTALDLPWQADGLQRDGPQVRVPVDRKLRAALQGAGIAFQVIAGQGPARVERAWSAIERKLALRASCATSSAPDTVRWRHACGRCGDPDCERHLFTGPGAQAR